MTVLYTPGQLRSAILIAPETYRHWKKALAPLRRGRGHSPCFSSGDLVAVSVVQALATNMAIRVGALAPIAETLFTLCNLSPWPALERAKLVIDVAGDGGANDGVAPGPVRDALAGAGVTVNGLCVLHEEPDLVATFQRDVIGGPGAFAQTCADYKDFAEAMRRKLLREISDKAVA